MRAKIWVSVGSAFLASACSGAVSNGKNMSVAQFEKIKRTCDITDAALEPLQTGNKITVYWKTALANENVGRFDCLKRELGKFPVVYGIQFS